MKKILFVLLFFYVYDVKAIDNLIVSKKSFYSGQYVEDCEFLLYDSDNKLIDSWIQDDDIHSLSVPNGSYLLFERPKINGVFSEYLGKTYKLDVNSDKIVEINLSNVEISIPPNLGIKFDYTLPILFIILGVLIILFCCKFNRI